MLPETSRGITLLPASPHAVDCGDYAPSVLVLLPFGQSHIAIGGGADGEGGSPPSPVSIAYALLCNLSSSRAGRGSHGDV
ncbi:hypothetical protein MchiMG62_23610 [Methanoculleus chikugoensis]|uniref:Uncharacterized protein n=1 Tax=Methanoculleus chikugoensis TaxID=118126 RepID=A0ABN5XLT3_9EURY|nr:hypothetical protein MchiMG62_23610 [Methanoculleus chikugoensis]